MRIIQCRGYTTAIQMLDVADKAQPRWLRLNWRSLSFESVASHSAKYRPDIDGLRALAVLAVVFYHAGFSPFRGGFVGVDIFYVISGYLITSLLAKDLLQGKFSIVSFYERRMRRIFPALFAVMFSCTAVALVLLDPTEMASFGRQMRAATLFVSNIYFWRNAQPLGYFDSTVRVQPLLHTWSLSVEEQFYVLFPLTLFLLFRWARRRVGLWLLLLTIASFALNLWTTSHRPVFAFYWFPPRAWELLIGALLALKILSPLSNRALREAAGLLGLGLIAASIFLPIENLPFPGYIVVLPCLGTWLVIYAGEAGPSITRTALSFRPLVFVGTISYSLYLWHWPIIVFGRHQPFHSKHYLEIFISFVLAFLSFEYIERPFRGTNSLFTRRQVFAFGAGVSALTAAFGFAAVLSQGLPQRYDARTRQLVFDNLAQVNNFDPSCGNWKNEVHSLADIKFCNLGDGLPHKIMFWGDSHVEQLYPAIQQLYASGGLNNRGVVFAIENGCLPDEHLNNTAADYHCDAFARFAMQRALQADIQTVYIGFSTWWARLDYNHCAVVDGTCGAPLVKEDLRRAFLADLAAEISLLRGQGKNVIVSLPFPVYDRDIPGLEISNAVFGNFGLTQTPVDLNSPSLREEIRAVALQTGADTFDPTESLCPGQRCLTERNGVSLYRDRDHLTRTGVPLLKNELKDVLTRPPAHQAGST